MSSVFFDAANLFTTPEFDMKRMLCGYRFFVEIILVPNFVKNFREKLNNIVIRVCI